MSGPSRNAVPVWDGLSVRGLRRIAATVSLCVWAAGITSSMWPTVAGAAGVGQASFATPDAAANALADAWRTGRRDRLSRMFGPAGERLVKSGDLVAEKHARERLAAEFDAGHRIETRDDTSARLILGRQGFPYPIPLVKEGRRWRFDAAAGAQEIVDRRVGRNELKAIEICRSYVEAQREYAAKDRRLPGVREYALKVSSSPGEHDGLYWHTREDEEQSPIGPLFAAAETEGYAGLDTSMRQPYHGYFYKILKGQGTHAPGGALSYVAKGRMTRGFALVAFPAKYGNSGVMTFVVNHDGIVYQRNLGPDTHRIASAMTEYDPGPEWTNP